MCPRSQSIVAYHTLQSRAIKTGLLIYPGEGHGWSQPSNKADSNRRILAWVHEFMPAK